MARAMVTVLSFSWPHHESSSSIRPLRSPKPFRAYRFEGMENINILKQQCTVLGWGCTDTRRILACFVRIELWPTVVYLRLRTAAWIEGYQPSPTYGRGRGKPALVGLGSNAVLSINKCFRASFTIYPCPLQIATPCSLRRFWNMIWAHLFSCLLTSF